MPFDLADPFNLGANSPFRPQQQPQQAATLAPQEEESILARLGNAGLGGLGYIGGSLDKAFGGRAIRGLLGGKPEELLSLIPFSDKLGITHEENAVSGKDLMGVDKHDDSWGGFFKGLAADVALDPATYLTFGGKTLLGEAAKKTSAIPKVVQPITRQAEGVGAAIKKFAPWNWGVSPGIEGQLASEMRGVGAASSEAGQIASKWNQLTPGAALTASDVADKPLAALATLSLPFGERLGMPGRIALGTGETAQNIANRFSNLKDAVAYSGVGRAVSPLFDQRLSTFGPNPTTEMGQRAVRGAADELAAAKPGVMGQFIDNRKLLEDVMTDPARAPQASRDVRSILEGTTGRYPVTTPELADPAVQQMISGMSGELAQARPNAASFGRNAAEWQGEHVVPGTGATPTSVDFTPRQWTPESFGSSGDFARGKSKLLSPANPNDIARLPELSLPGGTNAVNDLFLDPRNLIGPGPNVGVGTTQKRAAQQIRKNYLDWTTAQETEFARLNRLKKQNSLPEWMPNPTNPLAAPVQNPDFLLHQQLTQHVDQSNELARMASSWMKDQSHVRYPGGVDQAAWQTMLGEKPTPFANNILGEMHDYRLNDLKSNFKAKTFGDIVSSAASGVATPDTTSVYSLLGKAGYDNPNMKAILLDRFKQSGLLPANAKATALADVHVPAEVAADLSRTAQVFETPRVLQPLLKAWDTVTNLTKSSQTTMLPLTAPTLGRNFLTEMFVNFLGGARNPNASNAASSWAQPVLDSLALRGGKDISGLEHLPGFAGMTAAEQTRKFHEIALQHGVTMPQSKFDAMQLVGKGAHDSDVGAGVLGKIGAPQANPLEIMKQAFGNPEGLSLKDWAKEKLNPLNIRGVGNAQETTFAPVKAGQEVMHSVDDIGRQSAFLAYLQQGYEPEVAAARAKAMRMDPEKLTGFERDVMKRLIPYYGWLRTSIPGMAGELLREPGGTVGQSVRTSNALRKNEGMIPEYVGSGLAIPLGGRDENNRQKYLSGLGLPFEELNRLADAGPTPIATTARNLLGNINPLLKWPLEAATNTQLYSGRHLDDLQPKSGSEAVDQLTMNSPLGTAFRTLNTTINRGPGETLMNLLPTRITSADMNQEARLQREAVVAQLRTDPRVQRFERLFVPADQQAGMTEDERQLLALYTSLAERIRQQRLAQPR